MPKDSSTPDSIPRLITCMLESSNAFCILRLKIHELIIVCPMLFSYCLGRNKNNKNDKNMKVVVIGGGMGGVAACVGIRSYVASSTQVILVEPKDHVEICWATYRALFDPEIAKASLYPLDLFCSKHNVLHIMSSVTKLELLPTTTGDDNDNNTDTTDTDASIKVTCDNGTIMDDIDVCVVTTGATNPYAAWGRGKEYLSLSRPERFAAMAKYGKSLLDAKTVVIVGGGLVGTELAGDIAVFSRDIAQSTRVIIVHTGERLCHKELQETASKMLQEKLAELGVKSILSEKALVEGNKVTLESSGQVIQADQVIMANGIHPHNNSFVDAQYKDDKGWIVVDEYFRVKGAERKLFAFGDCATALPNTGNSIVNNISTIGYNVKGVLDVAHNGKEPWISKHAAHSDVYICTVGHDDGVAQTPLLSFDSALPAWKNYSMFLYDARSKLELELEEGDQKC
ncbi:Apoptosis-inducing factor homolog [Seminavis robusta]|uniref:Apoptosis-inducing factor homolog n=1 Tax=Seminavis robusta TaxID=568900 RepID=A0A9N8HYF0_9STRA|nr:Apoptosis-inducing factor homolog [Seminavis robusta]|eukprot:Sro2473_g328700.1 Apoptosis-inducing factor homolog (455) ;mRNA; r:8112-9476